MCCSTSTPVLRASRTRRHQCHAFETHTRRSFLQCRRRQGIFISKRDLYGPAAITRKLCGVYAPRRFLHVARNLAISISSIWHGCDVYVTQRWLFKQLSLTANLKTDAVSVALRLCMAVVCVAVAGWPCGWAVIIEM